MLQMKMALLCLYITEIIVPFNYNLLILLVEHAYMVCPSTFILKNKGEPLLADFGVKHWAVEKL